MSRSSSAQGSTISRMYSRDQQRQSSFTLSPVRYDMLLTKAEISNLAEDELRYVLFFRPGAQDDPSYRRVSIAALEYMKDIKSQLLDEVKNKTEIAMYSCEPPDTDTAINTGNISSGMAIDQMFFYPGGGIGGGRVSLDSKPTSATPSSRGEYDPIRETALPIPPVKIASYPELFMEATRTHRERRNIQIARIRGLDPEPLFDHMTQRHPVPFVGLQDAFIMIRNLNPNTTTISENIWSRMHNDSIKTNEDVELLGAQEVWQKNFSQFIHTANAMMGDFHGTLPFYWLNNHALLRYREEMANITKLPEIPTFQELDKSGYSISAFQRIKGGIRFEDKNVSVQILSLLDFRYRNADMTDSENPVFKYYRDSIIKLSKLVPNKRSFDVAVEVGMIPADMTSLIDFTWWTNNVIKVAREVEVTSVGKETYDLFVRLNVDYYNFFKSVKRDTAEQLKYNPVQFFLNCIMAILAVASLMFTTTGIIQVLQGFCVWKEYC